MTTLDFKQAGDVIFLLGKSREDLGSSEYLRFVKKKYFSPCPYFDLEEEVVLQNLVRQSRPFAQSVHDVSEGGLFQNLMESAMAGGLGFDITTDKNLRGDCFLFGESQSRVVISVKKSEAAAFENLLKKSGFPHSKIGEVVEQTVSVDGNNWGKTAAWRAVWDSELHQIMDSQ